MDMVGAEMNGQYPAAQMLDGFADLLMDELYVRIAILSAGLRHLIDCGGGIEFFEYFNKYKANLQ